MGRWLLVCAFSGLLLSGCYEAPAPDAAPSKNTPSLGGPSEGISSTDGSHRSTARGSGDSGNSVELDAITLTAPAGWRRTQTSSSFVAAEFVLSRAEGDEADGRLTVSTAGGSVEANIDRWKGQFGPQAKQSPLEEIDVDGIKVTIVDCSGDFNDQPGPFAPTVSRSNYRMIAAVVPIDGQLHFIKATGPQKTIAAHADEIRQIIRSIQRK